MLNRDIKGPLFPNFNIPAGVFRISFLPSGSNYVYLPYQRKCTPLMSLSQLMCNITRLCNTYKKSYLINMDERKHKICGFTITFNDLHLLDSFKFQTKFFFFYLLIYILMFFWRILFLFVNHGSTKRKIMFNCFAVTL